MTFATLVTVALAGAPTCEEPPTDKELLSMLPQSVQVPFLYEHHRDYFTIVKERTLDKVDPPRFFPLVGKARLHHCHWKCTVKFTETIRSDYPFPVKLKKDRTEVIYIDKDHLHPVGDGE